MRTNQQATLLTVPPFRYDFSVIIPTRNRPASLRNCLAALAQANYPLDRFEVIVVDDASEEPLAPLIADFSDRLRLTVLRQDERGGPAAARDHGSAQATGRFLAFTDDDDQPDRDWLDALHRFLIRSPDQLAGGRVINALERNPFSSAHQLIVESAYEYFDPAKGRPHFFSTGNMAVAAERFRMLGGFGNWPTNAAEDRAFSFRWLARGWSMTYVPDAIVRHYHPFNLASFAEVHFRYGRGAYHYHALRTSSGHGRLKPEWRFYWLSFKRAFSRNRPVSVAALLCLWQVANACGYFFERFAHSRANGHGG